MKKTSIKLSELAAAAPDLDKTRCNDAVKILRAKGYSWRRIQKWLLDQGIEVNYSTLSRRFPDLSRRKSRWDRSTRHLS